MVVLFCENASIDVHKLESDLTVLNGRLKDAQVEVATIKDFARTELQDMTENLIRVLLSVPTPFLVLSGAGQG